MFRESQGAMNNSFPQEKKRHWFLLIFLYDKSPPHFNGLAHHFMKFRLKPEKVLKVKAINAIFFKDLMTHSHPIGACNPFGVIIPKEHMVIIIIKLIEINGLICTFSYFTKSDLTQPTNFLQNIGDDLPFRQENLIILTFQ